MGGDHAFHIQTPKGRRLTGKETARLIAGCVKGGQYDLILAGIMSQDEQAGQVGPMVAVFLEIPWVSAVVGMEPAGSGFFRVQREREGGVIDTLMLSLPALVTIQTSANPPRYPTLTHVLRANRQEITLINAPDLAPACPVELYPPPEGPMGEFLEGTLEEKAEKLHTLLHERALL